MADYRALTVQSGITRQIQNGDNLITGAAIATLAGALTLHGFSGTVAVQANDTFSMTGTSPFNAGGSTGAFTTSTGAVTIGGAGGTATFSSTGNIFTNSIDPRGNITKTTAAALVINANLAQKIQIGSVSTGDVELSRVGSLAHVLGDLTVDGNTTLAGLTVNGAATYNANVSIEAAELFLKGDLTFHNNDGVAHNINVATAGALAASAALNIVGQTAGAGSGGNGGDLVIEAGLGDGAGTGGDLHIGNSTSHTENVYVNANSLFQAVVGGFNFGAGAGSSIVSGTAGGTTSISGSTAVNISSDEITETFNTSYALVDNVANNYISALTAGNVLHLGGAVVLTDVDGNFNLNGATNELQLNGSAGTSGQVLTSNGAGATPSWNTPASSAATSVDITLATGNTTGAAYYISSAGNGTEAIATAASTGRVIGIGAGSGTTVRNAGETACLIEGDGATAVNPGDPIYLSTVTAGAMTNVPDSTIGNVITQVGVYNDATFTPAVGVPANKLCVIQIMAPIQL